MLYTKRKLTWWAFQGWACFWKISHAARQSCKKFDFQCKKKLLIENFKISKMFLILMDSLWMDDIYVKISPFKSDSVLSNSTCKTLMILAHLSMFYKHCPFLAPGCTQCETLYSGQLLPQIGTPKGYIFEF